MRQPPALRVALWLATLMACVSSPAMADDACGSLATHYGPWDYRTDRTKLPIVEQHHFTPQVEMMLRGESNAYFEGDLIYTLNAFPNHHRALAVLVKLAERTHSRKPGRMDRSIDCYFDRALRWRPDDLIVRMLNADFLITAGSPDDAARQLAFVVQNAGDNPLTYHNAGLLYLKLGRMEEAAAQARKARELGYPRTELIDQLRAKGAWPEEGDAGSGAAAAPAAASAASR